MLAAPPKIDILPEHLIDQIKAGEVIERPGNLLKEILENSIDAGATKLEIQLRNNGLDLISLKDNGHGMNFNDLPLAFSRHATSKISRFEDLYRLRSFGFRGEALASISAISRLQCISGTSDGKEGAEIKIEGGATILHTKRQTCQKGTELIIKDLFYNTPARLKFIQSQNSEKQFIKKIIFSFILSNPQIEFHLKIDEGEKEIFPAAKDLLSRLEQIIPKAKDQILYSQKFYENNELEIYLIPGSLRVPGRWQYLFINNRFVLDKQLHKVISNSLQLSLGTDDYFYIAFLDLPADNIDVNVHPSKTVIKCLESSKIIGLITSTIKELTSPKKVSPNHNQNTIKANDLSFDLMAAPTLLQNRHEYNMEGIFSPHGTGVIRDSKFHWIEDSFIQKEINQKVFIFAAKSLLERYIYFKLATPAPSIPLLVSEPFSSQSVSNETIQELTRAGIEIEYMGSETLVLRGIPIWMNGFPLNEIISRLICKKSFSDYKINSVDWSNSTWEEMINSFPLDELLKSKIAAELLPLLRNYFK
jgi:DNA mismatch repair protein MutL